MGDLVTAALVVFLVSGLAGFAHLNMSRRRLTRRLISGTILYYGLAGVAIACLQMKDGYSSSAASLSIVYGILLGLSGLPVIEFMTRFFSGQIKEDRKDPDKDD